jgi:cytochrome c oxidase assembly protein subunit 11
MSTEPSARPESDEAHRARRLGWRLALAAGLMVGFGYALVPLYQVYCQLTGFNGTTAGRPVRVAATSHRFDASRLVTVEFVTGTAANLPWNFRPDTPSIEVHPGQMILATFHIRNLSGRHIVGQAVPSITPHAAAPHFHKIECFCFSRQPLAPGEARTMPVQFVVDADLPPEISTVTLAYTFFDLPVIRASLAAAPGS